jgi:uncharacterized protein (DUF58 family)
MPGCNSALLKKLRRLAASRWHADWLSEIDLKQAAGMPLGQIETLEHRDYVPGDDLWQVDWNLAARHDELRVVRRSRPVDRVCYLLLDVSASMGMGHSVKFEAARLAASALAYTALACLARVEMFAFSDQIVAHSEIFRGEFSALRALEFFSHLAPQDEATGLSRTADEFVGWSRRRGQVAIISDFYDRAGFEPALEKIRRAGYPLRLVRVFSPDEQDPCVLGDTERCDVETHISGKYRVTERHLARYRELYSRHRRSLLRYAAKFGFVCVELDSTAEANLVMRRATGRYLPLTSHL